MLSEAVQPMYGACHEHGRVCARCPPNSALFQSGIRNTWRLWKVSLPRFCERTTSEVTTGRFVSCLSCCIQHPDALLHRRAYVREFGSPL